MNYTFPKENMFLYLFPGTLGWNSDTISVVWYNPQTNNNTPMEMSNETTGEK